MTQFEIVKKLPEEEVIALYKEAGWWKENERARKIIPDMIEGSFCFMVAMDHNKLIGMGRVISDGFSDGYIQDVVVSREYRGQGIGKELVRRLAHFCMEKELEWIGLIAEPETAHFYEKLGFKKLNEYQPMCLQKELLQ